MMIRFWGVRGSVASPGSSTAKVGGNTPCVEVVCGDEQDERATRLVFDAGTGLRALGDALIAGGALTRGGVQLNLLFSHYHWDHIQGLPLFTPLYIPGTRLEIFGPSFGGGAEAVLEAQMQAPVFPVPFKELPSTLRFHEATSGMPFQVGAATVTPGKLNHPGGVLGYRVDYEGTSVVYATDTEHFSCLDPALLRLARGADVLIYDSMYLPEEYRGEIGMSKVGWGHSTFEAGAAIASAAGVKQLILFHHDPTRDDWGVVELEARARQLFPKSSAAREGQHVRVSRAARAA